MKCFWWVIYITQNLLHINETDFYFSLSINVMIQVRLWEWGECLSGTRHWLGTKAQCDINNAEKIIQMHTLVLGFLFALQYVSARIADPSWSRTFRINCESHQRREPLLKWSLLHKTLVRAFSSLLILFIINSFLLFSLRSVVIPAAYLFSAYILIYSQFPYSGINM